MSDIISKSGCRWIGNMLVHTDDCSCDQEYEELRDAELQDEDTRNEEDV